MKRSYIIAILVILAGLAGFSCGRSRTPAPWSHGPPTEYSIGQLIGAAESDVAAFKPALNMFEIDIGRYPTTAEGLDALIKRPATIPDGAHWHGPYLDKSKLPMDPWGRAYIYEIPGKHNPDGYDVYSLGPNGKGGDEAIGNWNVNQ